MSAGAIVVLMMAQEQERRRREEEERRRRRRQEERRREEERKRQEEYRKMVEHRKYSPIVCNDEQWQLDRCVKAISMQPCVRSLVSAIEKTRPKIIEAEEKKYNQKLLEVGSKYELLKNDLDSDIEILRKLGIYIEGEQYELSRLTPINTHMAIIGETTESFGNIFTIMDRQPIELNSKILSSEKYYEERYKEMNPEELEQEFIETNLKIKKYQKYGKYLKFLLRTKRYLELEEQSESLEAKYEQCELRKKEMQSFQSLSKEQLLAIKSYFIHLDQLTTISNKIKDLFQEKKLLRKDNNERIYDLTIKEIISIGDYNELLSETHDYISKIYSNDEEVMKQVYELVKGEYPIEILRRFIYNLIITNVKNYTKDDIKKLNLTNKSIN